MSGPKKMPERIKPMRERIEISDRELQILVGLSAGLMAKEMAERLFISIDTVKSHCSRLYDVLGARNGTHAVAIAYELGYLPVEEVPMVDKAGEVPQPQDSRVDRVGRDADYVALRPGARKELTDQEREELHARFPSLAWGEQEWVAVLDADYELLPRMVADIAIKSHALRQLPLPRKRPKDDE